MHPDHPTLYYVAPDYLRHLRQFDSRVSVKNQRPYVGIVTAIQGQKYVIPYDSRN